MNDHALNANKSLHTFPAVALKQLLWIACSILMDTRKNKWHSLVLDLLLNSWKSAL